MPKSTKTQSNITGVDYSGPKPFAFCGKLKWEINEIAHTKKVMDKVMSAVAVYEQATRGIIEGTLNSDSEFYQIYETSTRGILEATLIKFNYIKAANDPQAGPALLGILAGEVKDFLRGGGKHGALLLETRLNSMKTTS